MKIIFSSSSIKPAIHMSAILSHLNKFLLHLFLLIPLSTFCILTSDAQSIEKTFYLGDFHLENNITLPNANIKYVTYGYLNKDKTNAILLPSWYGGDYNGYNFLIGNDRALDTSIYFLIIPQLFGNGHSSSPSNTAPPFDGPRFPATSINDNVKAAYQLISKQFQLTRLKSVIGFSMGAEQAFQWAINYPNVVESIIPYCGTAKTYPHGYARLESAIAALEADENFNNGNYTSPPEKGLKAWALHWASWFSSQEWFRNEKFKQLGYATVNEFLNARIQKERLIDANDRINQARTWEGHDISNNDRFNRNIEKALASIQCKVLYMPSETDLYFPLTDAIYEKKFIPHVTFTPIPSVWGHIAGAGLNSEDNNFLNSRIKSFLSE